MKIDTSVDTTTVNVGETLNLTCTISGGVNNFGGNITLQWIGPGGDIVAKGVTTSLPLQRNTDSLSDSGIYTCNAIIDHSLYLISEIVRNETVAIIIPSKYCECCKLCGNYF